jgi:DNA invertase Pin-like site-specific DNA recombinase
MKTAAALLRVSTTSQELESQKESIRLDAEKLGYSIPDNLIFGEKISGDRPQYIKEVDENGNESGYLINAEDSDSIKELKAVCQNPATRDTIDCIFLWEISRLSRKQSLLLSHIEFFNVLKKPLYFTSHKMWTMDPVTHIKNDNSVAQITFLSMYIEQEHTKILERTRRGKQYAFQYDKDRFLGGNVPFGFNVTVKDTRHKFLVPNESELQVINDMYHKYNNELWSFLKIADYLNNTGIPTKKGGRWKKETVSRIFNNERLIGKRTYGNMEAASTPIIDIDTYNNGQTILENKRLIYGKKKRKYNYPLRGIIKCGVCGDILQCKTTKVAKQYYNTHVNVNKFRADAIVWEVIKNSAIYEMHLLHSSDQSAQYDQKIDANKRLIELNNKGINEVKKRRKDLLNLIENGIYVLSDIQEKAKSFDVEIRKFESDNRTLNAQIKQFESEKEITPESIIKIHNYVSSQINDVTEITNIFKLLIKEIKVFNYGKNWVILEIGFKPDNAKMIAINDRNNKRNEFYYAFDPALTVTANNLNEIITHLLQSESLKYIFIENDPFSCKNNEMVRLEQKRNGIEGKTNA